MAREIRTFVDVIQDADERNYALFKDLNDTIKEHMKTIKKRSAP